MTNYLKKSLLMAFVLPALVGGVMSCSSDDGYSAVSCILVFLQEEVSSCSSTPS